MLLRYFLGFILMVIPLWLTWRAIERTLQAEKQKSRSPFGEKLLRPAGESLRLRIIEIRDGIMEEGLWLSGAFVLPGLLLFMPNFGNALPFWLVWVAAAAICYGFARERWKKLFQLRESLRNHQLGFDGERYIAAELDTLRSHGFRIFHDFLVDWNPGGDATNFNIDHIAIGPWGIFAIETKARRKPNEANPGKDKTHEARFSGTTLQFAGGYEDTKAIKQAAKNAKALSNWLTASAPVRIEVFPVVVIPGWMIHRDGRGEVKVLSGKELAKHLPTLERPSPLPPETLRNAADRIEAHCRNVEGA